MKYDAQYFIEKFEAIPDELWCIGHSTHPDNAESHCALGHCGTRKGIALNMFEDARALWNMFLTDDNDIASINDGTDERYQQRTPKERILAALRDAKEAGL